MWEYMIAKQDDKKYGPSWLKSCKSKETLVNRGHQKNRSILNGEHKPSAVPLWLLDLSNPQDRGGGRWVRFDGTQGTEQLKELWGTEKNGTLKMDFLESTRPLVFYLSLLKLSYSHVGIWCGVKLFHVFSGDTEHKAMEKKHLSVCTAGVLRTFFVLEVVTLVRNCGGLLCHGGHRGSLSSPHWEFRSKIGRHSVMALHPEAAWVVLLPWLFFLGYLLPKSEFHAADSWSHTPL